MDSLDMYGTALHCDVLTAYRRDLERTPDVVRFGPEDERWLRYALAVERASVVAQARPRRPAARGARPVLRPKRLLAVAEQMEAAGALTLSFTTLAAARLVWDREDPASAGTAIFHQARICRTSGATQAAENFYAFLFTFATRHRLAELRGRALVGRGIVRMLGGDPEGACRWYAKARIASHNHPVAIAVSYHGEMAAALASGDVNRAIVAGDRALRTGALGSYDEAGVMVNIATIALRAGRPKAALSVLKQAISRTRHPRVRLIAYSKVALAAAALNRKALVERMSARFMATAAQVNIPFEELEARSEVAQALATVGETTRARRLARAARSAAHEQGFAIIVQRCDALLSAQLEEIPPVELNAPARRIVTALELV